MDLTVFGYSLTGLFKRIYFGVTGREVIVTGECRMCGSCCRSLNLHAGGRWLRGAEEFRRLARKHPEYERFEPAGRTEAGALKFRCRALGGDGLCADHEKRPEFCRAYPTPDLYFMGATIKPHCGYRFEVVPSFRKALKSSLRRAGNENP